MKIAIVKLSALGDIVHAMVALQFIKAVYPEAQIDWVVEEGLAGVLENNPHINRILPVRLKALKNDKSPFFDELAKVRQYATEGYDLVIDAQGLIKSAVVARLMSKHCAGFNFRSAREKWAALLYRYPVDIVYHANTIDRNVAVLTQPLGFEVSRQQIIDKQPFLFFRPPQFELSDYFVVDKPNVILVIGSTWPSRNYPLEKFQQLIDELDANFLICWGNGQEHWMAQWLAERTDAKVLPKLSLNDLKAAIAYCDLLIGNDTGPTHMAWGLNRPSITLFGPTPVSRVYQTPINRVLKSPSKVDPYKLDKNDFSIGEIAVSEVAELAMALCDRIKPAVEA